MTGTVEHGTNEDPGTVRVWNDGTGLACEIEADGHRLVSDEPASAGGGDAGPSPYGHLLASLGACTAMTLRLYADRKGLALRRVRVRLSHGRSHARDCEHCEEPNARVERITRRIVLEGELSDEQRARLLQIAERCPVHRTLTGTIEIATDEEPA